MPSRFGVHVRTPTDIIFNFVYTALNIQLFAHEVRAALEIRPVFPGEKGPPDTADIFVINRYTN